MFPPQHERHESSLVERLTFLLFERTFGSTVYARSDLAAMLLDQLDDDRFVRRIAAVT